MTPADATPWQGRIDSEDGELGLRWHQVVSTEVSEIPGAALLGFASDLGVTLNKGRPGAAEGPPALRRALANMAWHHHVQLMDAGDVPVTGDLAAGQATFAAQLSSLLEKGHFVLGLGGGHEIGWASYQGCRDYLQRSGAGQRLGIINFDAHFDLRLPAPHPSSGTPFYQVAEDCETRNQPFDYCCIGVAPTANTRALFQRAATLGVRHLLDIDCHGRDAKTLLQEFIAPLDALYVTVCLDVLPPASAPGVSAPAAPGVEPAWILRQLALIGDLCRHFQVNWLMADVAELCPPLDFDARTARLGARVLDTALGARRPGQHFQ
ncbi:formimidoylglutamase [Parahaliea aestuarii]|uniref:Formimidoylglutamase n=1 Tax=Parahaliea aestuarii TaxID=1852021 RepID=A0A5C8ZWZ5_9GAMM|nr:formimidoylglutamase [Parahaliea aestuarii]TXS91711.1 formimidoylglutamase [Parahaliea aestuarii]